MWCVRPSGEATLTWDRKSHIFPPSLCSSSITLTCKSQTACYLQEDPRKETGWWECYLADAQVFSGLGVVVDAHLLNGAKPFAHVLKEVLVDVVIQIGESHLFGWRCSNIVVVILKWWEYRLQVAEMWTDLNRTICQNQMTEERPLALRSNKLLFALIVTTLSFLKM